MSETASPDGPRDAPDPGTALTTTGTKLPRRVLIANRGEIAVRVARTCHARGVQVVAVHTEHDATAPHVLAADAAMQIAGYTNIDALVEAATTTKCDAVHPGYGFLSENPDFARAVEDAGLVFIGPPAQAIESMSSKPLARALMAGAGVPVVPGSEPGDVEALTAAAEDLGYPVFLKAVAGGGGKGIAIVETPERLRHVARQASEEAERSFGDGALYVEKVVQRPRHVEIQVFGDRHGNTVALGERECSIQRRHQKIIEETPSPALDPTLRERMSDAAVAAARAVDYVGAGTVEFLLDEDGGFYFLEMNTRLQVEHPVTEWVTGLDLVGLQLEVAAGQPLPAEALEPTFLGHAVECRVYAEDPAAGHLPQSGTLLLVREPGGPGIRVDSALAEGQEVSIHFDPLLAKVSTWGRDRTQAIARMREALHRFVILGVRTNLDHLQDVLDHPAFREGALHTGFLDEHFGAWPGDPELDARVLAATALAERRGGATSGLTLRDAQIDNDPWGRLGRFRLGASR